MKLANVNIAGTVSIVFCLAYGAIQTAEMNPFLRNTGYQLFSTFGALCVFARLGPHPVVYDKIARWVFVSVNVGYLLAWSVVSLLDDKASAMGPVFLLLLFMWWAVLLLRAAFIRSNIPPPAQEVLPEQRTFLQGFEAFTWWVFGYIVFLLILEIFDLILFEAFIWWVFGYVVFLLILEIFDVILDFNAYNLVEVILLAVLTVSLGIVASSPATNPATVTRHANRA